MADTVIQVENLGKKYIITHQQQERYVALRDVLANGAKFVVRQLRYPHKKLPNPTREEFWAVKDLSFEIKQGDRVGIIGRNGAGKSTLLKLLSRITEPTMGRITLRGQVASLLEVGTGFHPELTGRENVYLNGSILGMSRAEIKRKFDEIIAFAEVERFLDTPVKRYSSGMYVRLAFAVAAYLDPEILIVDEVLAVGDARFQEKCLGKMEEVSSSGRTVLFVSHNMDSIRKLCSYGIYMSSGKVQYAGSIDNAINQYLFQFPTHETEDSGNVIHFKTESNSGYYVDRIEVLELDETPKNYIKTWDSVRFRIFFYAPENLKTGSVVLQIATFSGTVITLCSTQPDSLIIVEFQKGINYIDCVFPRLVLSAGKYLIGAALAIPNAEWLYRELEYATLQVLANDVFNSGLAPVESRYLIPQEHRWES